ncbi:ATP-binding protein [Streptosporangium sp. NBC_01755]|uniref:ATP-binding protein n=1 Tax=Streptosporangium sp. NBC_01755 TaxID=2975949 RepID=UPI002DDB47B8|nr:ATP-binding protein [Streptosporangium sp. NBC_01755]WSD02637.1 ATP-binding protein [Streptosporangium sp. NBC_01755]
MIDDVVREWPDVWRYPDLAAALARGDASTDLAMLLLRGLAEPLTVEQSAHRLIADGEFRAVEELHQKAHLPVRAAKDIADRLERARAAAAVRVHHDAVGLERRSARAGVSLDVDVRDLTDDAWLRLADADAKLGELDETVRSLEEQASVELRRSLAARAAELDGQDRAVAAWLESAEVCIQAGEFDTAKALIGDGPQHRHADTEPRLVPRLREDWPYEENDLETIMSWYFEPGAPYPPGFATWLPARDDAEAWALLRALRDTAREVTHDTVSALLRSLHRLLGTDRPWLELDDVGHRVLTRISLPDNARLPCLAFLGRRELATWVSNPRRPHDPPACDGPLLWIAPSVRAQEVLQDRRSVRGVAKLDATFLLRLVAPVHGRRLEPAVRLINLLRAICPRLAPDEVMNWREAAEHPQRHHLTWLLHLLGISADMATTDAVRYDVGDNPAVLRRFLAEVVPGPPRHDRARSVLLDLALLNEVRGRDEWRTEAVRDLLAPHAGERAALALLWAAIDFDSDEFTLDDLREDLTSIAEAEVAEVVVSHSGLPAGAAYLVREGLFEGPQEGPFRLPASGIRALLTEKRPGHVPRDQAVLAARAVYEEYRDTAARRIAEVGDRIVRVIGHKMNGRRAVIRSALEEERAEYALDVVKSLPSIHGMYTSATAPERPCRLTEILKNPLSVAQGDSGGMLRYELQHGEDLFVHANPWVLSECFFNLFDNSRLAVRETGREFGDIRVTVTVEVDDPTRCLIDIEDSGIGLSAEARERLAREDRFSSHGGSGVGFRTARSWFRAFGGHLEIVGRSAVLGGAHLRVTLPLTDPPAQM